MKNIAGIPKLIDEIVGGLIVFMYSVALALRLLIISPFRNGVRLHVRWRRNQQLSSMTLLFVGAVVAAATPKPDVSWVKEQIRDWSEGAWYSTAIAAFLIFLLFDLTARLWTSGEPSARRRQLRLDVIRYGAAATLCLLAAVNFSWFWYVMTGGQNLGIFLAGLLASSLASSYPWLCNIWILRIEAPGRDQAKTNPRSYLNPIVRTLSIVRGAMFFAMISIIISLALAMGPAVRFLSEHWLSPRGWAFEREVACVIQSNGSVTVAVTLQNKDADTAFVTNAFLLSVHFDDQLPPIDVQLTARTPGVIEAIPAKSNKVIQLVGDINSPTERLKAVRGCFVMATDKTGRHALTIHPVYVAPL